MASGDSSIRFGDIGSLFKGSEKVANLGLAVAGP